jgi:O-antigen ligase
MTRRLPAGTAVFSALLALYYGTVVLSSAHFAVLQVVTLWGMALILMPAYRVSLARGERVMLLSMTALFAVAALSYAVNGLWDHPDANLSRYARFLFFVPIYMVARRFATAAGFWFALLLGSLTTGFLGVLEFAGLVRFPGDLWPEVNGAVNPIQFGDLSLTMAMMTCAGLPAYRQRGRPYLVLAGFAVVLALFGCLASNTRGAWIAVPALAVLVIWGYLRCGLIRPRQLLGLAITGVVVAAILIPRTDFVDQVHAALQELREYGQGRVGPSVGVRLELWRASWETFMQQPVLGVGPGLYGARARALMAERGGYPAEALEFSHPHSEYFFVLATLGGLGMLSLLLLFLLPLYRFGRAMLSGDDGLRCPGLAGTIMVVGYLHFGLTEALMFQHATFLGFYLLTVAVLSTLIGRQQPEFTAEKDL